MSAQPKASEPSMEEILASIRRIIADDQVKPAAPSTAAPPAAEVVAAAPPPPAPVARAPEPSPAPVVEALDLGIEATPAEEPQSQDDIDLLFNEVSEPEPEPVFTPPPVQFIPPAIPEPVAAPVFVAPAPVAPAAPMDMSGLISAQASGAVASAFGALSHTVLANNGRTMDDLVQDMLKPMLKSWLDENLPSMVERLVRAEIERVARGGRG
ncbi:MAG: PopZ family protein [Bosea sp. (in: a-proteobacteria)]